jgi:cytoskeletal protein RodZ
MTHDEKSHGTTEGLSRRDMLKRGAVIGGLVWTVPAIQAVTMSSASAAEPSTGVGPHQGHRPHPKPNTPPGTQSNSRVTSRSVSNATSSTSVSNASASGVSPSAGMLPHTGSDIPIGPTAAVGAGLVAAGVAATVAARRRAEAELLED